MRRRLPGLLGRVGGIVAVDANRFWQRIIKSSSAEADLVSEPGQGYAGKERIPSDASSNLVTTKARDDTTNLLTGAWCSGQLMLGSFLVAD